MEDRFVRSGAPGDASVLASFPRPTLLQHFVPSGSGQPSGGPTIHSRLIEGTGSGLDTWIAAAAAASVPTTDTPGSASLTVDAPSAPAQHVNSAWILPLTARRTQLHGQLLEAELLGSDWQGSSYGAGVASPVHDRAALLSAAHATEDDGTSASAAATAVTRHRAATGAARGGVLFPRGDDVSRQLHAEGALLASAVAIGTAHRPRSTVSGDQSAADAHFALAAAATAQAARAGLSPDEAGEAAAAAMSISAAAAGSVRIGLPAAFGLSVDSAAALSGSTLLGGTGAGGRTGSDAMHSRAEPAVGRGAGATGPEPAAMVAGGTPVRSRLRQGSASASGIGSGSGLLLAGVASPLAASLASFGPGGGTLSSAANSFASPDASSAGTGVGASFVLPAALTAVVSPSRLGQAMVEPDSALFVVPSAAAGAQMAKGGTPPKRLTGAGAAAGAQMAKGGTPPKRPRVLTPSDLPTAAAAAGAASKEMASVAAALPAARSPPGSPKAAGAGGAGGPASSSGSAATPARQTPGRSSVRSARASSSSLLSSPGRGLGSAAAAAAAVVVSPGRVQMRIVRPAPPPPLPTPVDLVQAELQADSSSTGGAAGAVSGSFSLPSSAPPSWRSVPSRGGETPGRPGAVPAHFAAVGTPGRSSVASGGGSMHLDAAGSLLGSTAGSSASAIGGFPGTPSRRLKHPFSTAAAAGASIGAELSASMSLAASGLAGLPSDLDVAQGSGAAVAGAIAAAAEAALAAAGALGEPDNAPSEGAVDLGATVASVASLLSLGSARSSLSSSSLGASGGFGAGAGLPSSSTAAAAAPSSVAGTPLRRPNMAAASVTASGGAASVALTHASIESASTAAGAAALRSTPSWFGGSVAASLTPGRAAAAARAAEGRAEAQIVQAAQLQGSTSTPGRNGSSILGTASPGRQSTAAAAPGPHTGIASHSLAMASPPRAKRLAGATPGRMTAGTDPAAGGMRVDGSSGAGGRADDDGDSEVGQSESVGTDTSSALARAVAAASLASPGTPWATPAAVAAAPAAAMMADRALTLAAGQPRSSAASTAALASPGRVVFGGASASAASAAVRASALLAAGAPSLGPSAVTLALAEGQSLVSHSAATGRTRQYYAYDGSENAAPAAAAMAAATAAAALGRGRGDGSGDGDDDGDDSDDDGDAIGAGLAAPAIGGAGAAPASTVAAPASTAAALRRREAAASALQHSRLAPLLSPAGQALLAPSPVSVAHATAAAAAAAAAASSPAEAAAAVAALAHRQPRRAVPRLPFKVLDAPALPDDFYINPLHWGASNLLAVGLSADLYLWNAATSSVDRLVSYAPPPASSPQSRAPPPNAGATIASVRWAPRGQHIAVGLSTGSIEIWDASAQTVVRRYEASQHNGVRVPSMAWNGQTLASGGRDGTILLRDARDRDGRPYASLLSHGHEVCGLEWSPDGEMLASGSNDNRVAIWAAAAFRAPPRSASMRAGSTGAGGGASDADGAAASWAMLTPSPLWKFTQFTAAVKALAWSPHERHLLAAGGGTNDKKIRFLSSASGEVTGAIDAGAQVAQLAWCPHAPELASALGFSQNALAIWRYPSMNRLATLMGHTSRVLFMALAPDGQVIVTGAGDETLRFWAAFPPPGSYWPADKARGESASASSAAVSSPLAAAPADGHISSLLLDGPGPRGSPAGSQPFLSPPRSAPPLPAGLPHSSPLAASWAGVR